MRTILATVIASLVCLALATAGGEDHEHPDRIDDARFQYLAELAGTWKATASDGSESVFEYGLSAGGTVVVERLMAGSPMEMLTVYFMDGGTLRATHYCMLGNAPQLSASSGVEDGALAFACDGKVSNASSHDEAHIHGWKMARGEGGSLEIEVQMVENGETVEHMAFRLERAD